MVEDLFGQFAALIESLAIWLQYLTLGQFSGAGAFFSALAESVVDFDLLFENLLLDHGLGRDLERNEAARLGSLGQLK